MPASKLPAMPAFPLMPDIDAGDVRQALSRIRARCESEGKDDPNAQWVARLIGGLDGAESRILQLTTSQVVRGALEAAQVAAGVEVEAPGLVSPLTIPVIRTARQSQSGLACSSPHHSLPISSTGHCAIPAARRGRAIERPGCWLTSSSI